MLPWEVELVSVKDSLVKSCSSIISVQDNIKLFDSVETNICADIIFFLLESNKTLECCRRKGGVFFLFLFISNAFPHGLACWLYSDLSVTSTLCSVRESVNSNLEVAPLPYDVMLLRLVFLPAPRVSF